jgi:hypothetical protein
MKKIILSFLIGSVLLACAEEQPPQMVVKGQVAGLKKGILYLQHVPDSALITLDSLVVQGDGAFRFEVPLQYPELFYLYLDKADNNAINDRLSFFGEPGEVNIQTRWDGFDTRAKISGSAVHTIYIEYKEVMSQFNTEYLALVRERLAVRDSTRAEILTDSLDQRIEQNTLRSYLYAVNFALNNRNSHIAPYVVVAEIPDIQPRFMDTIYNALPDSIIAGTYGQRLKSMIEERKRQ